MADPDHLPVTGRRRRPRSLRGQACSRPWCPPRSTGHPAKGGRTPVGTGHARPQRPGRDRHVPGARGPVAAGGHAGDRSRAVTLFATACGGGGSPSSTAGPPTLSTLTDQALAYAKCTRAHGIPSFPDPSVQDNAHAKGVGFSLGNIDTHSAQFTSAAKLCVKQTGFGHITTAQLQAGMNAMLKFAECMRSHGIAHFPDPFENSHQIGFNLDSTGIAQNSSRFKAAPDGLPPAQPDAAPDYCRSPAGRKKSTGIRHLDCDGAHCPEDFSGGVSVHKSSAALRMATHDAAWRGGEGRHARPVKCVTRWVQL